VIDLHVATVETIRRMQTMTSRICWRVCDLAICSSSVEDDVIVHLRVT